MMMKLNGCFLTEDVLPLDNYNEICERTKEVLEKDLIANSLYNNENLKTKIKFHERKTFCTIKKFLKNFHCIFLSMILSDSGFKKIKKKY